MTGEWFQAPEPESGESPISWEEGMNEPGPGPEPPVADTGTIRVPANSADGPAPPGAGRHRPVQATRSVPPAPPVVSPTRALRGRPGGPGFQPRRPAPGAKRVTAGLSPWQKSHRLWSEAEIPWEQHAADGARPAEGYAGGYEPGAEPRPAHPDANPETWPQQARPPLIPPPRSLRRPAAASPEQLAGTRPEGIPIPLGAPVYTNPVTGPQEGPRTAPQGEPGALADAEGQRSPDAAPPLWLSPPEEGTGGLLEPGPPRTAHPATWRPGARHGLLSRRAAAIVVPVAVLVAVAVLALSMLTGQGPKLGPLTASQQGRAGAHQDTAPLTIGMYPGQQQRGVFQTVNRVVASGATIVAMGSQTSDGAVRQQFFVSANGGASWRLAPVQAPGGGQPALGYPAARLAGGPAGWLAVGAQATWTSPNGLSWTLAATHGITPMLPGDGMWVLNSTSSGFLAAGVAVTSGHATQAVVWTSRNGLTWQRKTAAQLGLAGPGETVQSISYITSRGPDTLISGQVTNAGASYSGVWLSTDGGSTWTRVFVPAGYGAGTSVTGLAADASGLLAVRAGSSASGRGDAVTYFSPNGTAWQYAGTISASAGWTPSLVKGSDDGFVVAGTAAGGQLVAFTAAGRAGSWAPTGSLGEAGRESVVGAAVAPAGTIVAVGYTSPGQVAQQPVFEEASAAGGVRPVPLAGIAGGSVPELTVNGLSVAAGQQIAVGSSEGYPAVWHRTSDGSWALVTSLAGVSGASGLQALTGVTHGSSGWLAVGTPGPVVMTSATGTSWQSQTGTGSIAAGLAGVAAVATAAGPHGYVIVGKLVGPGGGCVADVWWSPNLTSWTRAHDVNDVTGSSQVLAVAASASGFVSVGSHDGKPAVWTTADGTTWTTIVLPVPAGASSAVLQQVATSGTRVVAVGQQTTPAGTVPLAELSVDGGASWQQVPLSSPGPDTTFTALTADSGGFAAAAEFGAPGQQQIAAWTSAAGTAWTPVPLGGVTGTKAGGSEQLSALASSGNTVIAIGSTATQSSDDVFTVSRSAR